MLRIEPSSPGFHLGFIHQMDLGKDISLSFNGIKVFGGNLKEKTCEADYGVIGGVQEVNCRLAASLMTPAQTLSYLLNEKSKDEQFMIKLTYSF